MLTFYNSQYIVIIGHEFDDAPHQHFMKHILIALEGTAKCMIAGNEIFIRRVVLYFDGSNNETINSVVE